MNGGTCAICGQPITDASGSWDIVEKDRGINALPGCLANTSFRCCAWCHEAIEEAIQNVAVEHREERKKW